MWITFFIIARCAKRYVQRFAVVARNGFWISVFKRKLIWVIPKHKGSKKQRLHHWRSQEVQRIVTDKAHRLGIRISRINPYGTSRYAYDGSGQVLRGKEADLPTYELCKFQTGKTYNCDLSASYNIGARYFIREILKSLAVRSRLQVEAKVPALCKRSTCTLADLINLYAAVVGVPSTCWV